MTNPRKAGRKAKDRAACDALPSGTLAELKAGVRKSLIKRGAFGREYFRNRRAL